MRCELQEKHQRRYCQFIQLWQSLKLCQSVYRKDDELGLLRGFGRYRRDSEGD